MILKRLRSKAVKRGESEYVIMCEDLNGRHEKDQIVFADSQRSAETKAKAKMKKLGLVNSSFTIIKTDK